MRRIGVFTSGGDSPGMNAAVRAVVRTALSEGIEVLGFNRGFKGIHDRDYVTMDRGSVSNIVQRGGSVLYSSRFPEFKDEAIRQKCYANLKDLGVDGLVACGGDGTLHGAQCMIDESDLRVVGLPGTIDNDLAGTDFTIGYDTALNTALDAIDKIRDTAETMERVFFIEVMGRHSGYLALETAVAGGAEAVLVPEINMDTVHLAETLSDCVTKGNRTFIVVVAEGDEVGGAQAIADHVSEKLDIPNWVAVLGYIQRGGSPTARDRLLASKLGHGAVHALIDGAQGVLIGEVNGLIVRTPFTSTWTTKKELDKNLLRLMFTLTH